MRTLAALIALLALAPLVGAATGPFVHHQMLAPEDVPVYAGAAYRGNMIYLWTAVEGESYEASVVPDDAANAFNLEAYPSSQWSCSDDCPAYIAGAANCEYPHSVASPTGGSSSFAFTASEGGTYYLQVNTVNAVGAGPFGYTLTFARADGTSPDDIHASNSGTGEGIPLGPACAYVEGKLV